MYIAYEKYYLQEKVGEGSFGQVYRGINTRTKESVAIKVEPIIYNLKLLKNETKIYQFLRGIKGIPEVKWFGKDETNYYMVMDLLSVSLEDKLQEKKERKFSLSLTCQIGIQILDILEKVHNKGIIHRDIKPDNFLLLNNDVYLIDFGFCKSYLDVERQHIQPKATSGLIGSPKFASVHAHNHLELSRRDDLESLAYMLSYFVLSYMEPSILFKMKMLPSLLPDKLSIFLETIRAMEFEETPDYCMLRNIIK